MPTIKTKKEMNLPELIEWGWKNEFISSVFWTSNREEGFNHKAFDEIVEVFKDYPIKTDSDVMDFIQAKLDDMEDK